jgi:hypothetical protein
MSHQYVQASPELVASSIKYMRQMRSQYETIDHHQLIQLQVASENSITSVNLHIQHKPNQAISNTELPRF